MNLIEEEIQNKQTKDVAKTIVDNYFGINIGRKTNQRKYVMARSIFYKILRYNTKMSYQDIANTFNKNHATVLHAIKQLDGYMEFDSSLKIDYITINDLFLNTVDKLLTEKFNDIESIDPQYIDILNSFNQLSRKYDKLKQIHNDLVISSEKVNQKYKKLKEFSDERESYYQRNGYVIG